METINAFKEAVAVKAWMHMSYGSKILASMATKLCHGDKPRILMICEENIASQQLYLLVPQGYGYIQTNFATKEYVEKNGTWLLQKGERGTVLENKRRSEHLTLADKIADFAKPATTTAADLYSYLVNHEKMLRTESEDSVYVSFIDDKVYEKSTVTDIGKVKQETLINALFAEEKTRHIDLAQYGLETAMCSIKWPTHEGYDATGKALMLPSLHQFRTPADEKDYRKPAERWYAYAESQLRQQRNELAMLSLEFNALDEWIEQHSANSNRIKKYPITDATTK